MIDGLRIYLRCLGISIRAQLQYRGAFVLAAIGQFLITSIEMLGLWALFDRFGKLQGWTLGQAAVFYGVVNTSFAVADALCTGFDRFGDFVKRGDFDRVLLRPRSTALQLAGQELTLKRIGRLLNGLLALGIGARLTHTVFGPAEIALLLFALLGGACLFLGLIVLQATISFWTTESLELMNVLTYGGVETAQYPLSIYQRWFQRFFIFVVPLACVSYFPVVAILGVDDPLGSSRMLQRLSPLAGLLFLWLSLRVWHFGVRHYTSTGS